MSSKKKQMFIAICLGFIFQIVVLPSSVAAAYRAEEKVYVVSSVAAVRAAPLDDSPIAAKLPIGTKAEFVGTPSDVAGGPNHECKDATKGVNQKGDEQWSCVCISDLPVDYGEFWCGWIATDLLGDEQPKLNDLLARYDETPPMELSERRKWAERAAAIDPLSAQARERLLDTLEKMNDLRALEAARDLFDSYLKSEPRSYRPNFIFSLVGEYLEPIAEFTSGQLVPLEFDQSVNYSFRNRGQFYSLYSHGKKIGTVITESQFDCRVAKCPQKIARSRQVVVNGQAELDHGIVTNFSLSTESHVVQQITKQQRSALMKMAATWIDTSSLDEKRKKAFRQYIKKFDAMMTVGSFGKDGRLLLIGNWVMSSMNDEHYNDGSGDVYYESLLIVAEQDKDGTFKVANGSGSLTDSGCSYFDQADFDGDGIDDIVLLCEGLEGAYGYAFFKRIDDEWKVQ